jgi:hypothetical protein
MTRFILAAATAAAVASPALGNTFTYGGYTFDDGGPSSATTSGNVGTFGIGFGFDGNSSGQLVGGTDPSAVSLGDPNLDTVPGVPEDGSVTFSYSSAPELRSGVDFVIFESGTKNGLGFGAGSGFEGFVLLVDGPGAALPFPGLTGLALVNEASGFVDINGNMVAASDDSGTAGFFTYEVDVEQVFATLGGTAPTGVSSFTISSPRNASGAAFSSFSAGSLDPDIAFIGTVVPEPVAAMGGLSLLSLVGLRRRQQATA